MDLRERQAPLKQRYREDADAARITLSASASETDAPISWSPSAGRSARARPMKGGWGRNRGVLG